MEEELLSRIKKAIEEETKIVHDVNGNVVMNRVNYSSDDFSRNEGNVLRLIQNNNPKFSSAKFKQNAYACFRKVMFAILKEDSSIFRPFVTDKLYELLNTQIAVTRRSGYIHVMEHFVVYRNFLNNYVVKDEEERIGLQITIKSKDYFKALNNSNGYLERPDVLASYYLEFIKKKGIEYSNEIITSNCPNCGAPLDIHSNGECEHCKKIVTRGEYSWTLNKLCYWDERFL